MDRTLIFCLLGLLAVQFAYSQDSNQQAGVAPTRVLGKVIDKQNGTPLEFATVSIYSRSDSALVTGAIANGKGNYEVPVKPGNYYVEIGFIGYKSAREELGEVEPSQNVIDLGTTSLISGDAVLQEVEVRAKRSQMQMELDKRVFDVSSDLANRGMNASAILDNLPSVEVDLEGNVSLRGSQNVRVLVNGKPSGLVGLGDTEALRLLQGNLIERVEVITNPSARYDAEGEVGIINIILKKNKKKGINGSVDVTAGYPDNYQAGFNMNYRQGIANVFASYGFGYRNSPGSGSNTQEINTADTSFIYNSESERQRRDLSHNIRSGVDLNFNPENQLSASVVYQYSNGFNTTDILYTDLNERNETIRQSSRRVEENESDQDIEVNLSYKRTFDKEGQEFTIDAKWVDTDNPERATIEENVITADNDPLIQRTDNQENEVNFLFQTDYVHPFGDDGKFETGLKATLRTLDNDFLAEEQNPDTETYSVIRDFDNNFIYREDVYAAYAIVGDKFSKIGWQIGLRGELTDIGSALVATGESNDRSYFNLFPSAFLSYELTEKNSLQFSYSKRLSRPRFRWLLPFSNFSDNRRQYRGNPNLNPEFTDSYEVTLVTNFEIGSFLASAYHRHREGVVERIALTDSTGFITRFPVNLSVENAVGVELSTSLDITTWWTVNNNFNFYRSVINGNYEGQDLNSETYTWNNRFTSRMKIKDLFEFQAQAYYRAPRIEPQGRDLSVYSINLGLSREILNGQGTLSLSVRDLLNSRKWRSVINQEELVSRSSFQWRARQILLSFNYRINQDKSGKSRKKGY